MADNYTRPESKARWGFSGTIDNIVVGAQTVGETLAEGEVVSVAPVVLKDNQAANNGGGKKDTE